MTNRENFFSLIRRQGYEYVPVEFHLCPSLEKEFRERTGSNDYEEYFQFPWRYIEDIRLPGHDVEQYRRYYKKPLAEGAEIDLWGVGHESSPHSMHMTYMRHPLEDAETLEEIMEYPYPDFEHGEKDHQKEQVKKIKERDLIAVGNMQTTIWETAWYLRGMENLFCDMMEEDEMAVYLLDKITELAKIRLYCTWLKPRLTDIISYIKSLNPDVIVFYHSCGFIEPLIPHLIDAGVDVLNPIQSECMDFGEIYEKYGDKISFHGTIGTQTVMPHGTPEEVIAEVHKNLDIAGPKGGLMAAPTHLLEPEVPFENVLAYAEACRTYQKKEQ